MNSIKLPLVFCILILSQEIIGQDLAQPILLWPEGAPGATGQSDEDKPAIIPFIPDSKNKNGAAILVVPGGGFTIRAVDHEGVLVAQWLKDHGITAFVLRYRLRPLYDRTHWVMDGQKAMQYLREHASEYNIDPNRVGSVGFSAGASLIVDMSLNDKTNNSEATTKSKPDFMILAYGAMPIPPSIDSARVANLPPTFLYGTSEDVGSMGGLMQLHNRLYKAGVPVEAHFFRNGIHGTGFAVGDPILGQWPSLMYNWLQVGGYLTSKEQLSISGIIKLDGTPLLKGMLILKSVDDVNAPPVIVYMNNTGTGELGRFEVPKSQGPVKGKYRVEVRQDATRWTSNSRDPFMISMMEKQRSRTLTEQDRIDWGEYLRKRNLSPSIDNQRVYSRQHPKDKNDYVIDIKEGAEFLIEVFSK